MSLDRLPVLGQANSSVGRLARDVTGRTLEVKERISPHLRQKNPLLRLFAGETTLMQLNGAVKLNCCGTGQVSWQQIKENVLIIGGLFDQTRIMTMRSYVSLALHHNFRSGQCKLR